MNEWHKSLARWRLARLGLFLVLVGIALGMWLAAGTLLSAQQVGDDDAPLAVTQPALSVTKIVTPTEDVPYRSAVTYSVMLNNSGPVSDTGVLLTDTLPAEVDFVRWAPGGRPAGAEVVADELIWSGTVTAGQAIAFTFVVSHVGDYGDVVTNTARFSGTQQAGEDDAIFIVAGRGMYTTYLSFMSRNPICESPAFPDFARDVRQTADGGYVVVGSTWSFVAGHCHTEAWVLKLDADGDIAWQKTYGGADDDYATAIQQTADGGYIVVGDTYSFGAGESDAWVLKLNADGSVAWQKTYGGTSWEYPHVIQTADDGYVVVGYTYSFGAGKSDAWVLKLDADGGIAWQKTYGGTSWDSAYAIQQTADGGYVVAGDTESFGAAYDAWVLKLDAGGNIAWQRTYGGTSGDHADAIQQTGDGGYVVAGETWSFGAGQVDTWVLELDAGGNVVWQKTYGGEGYDYVYTIQRTADDGYVVVGVTQSFGVGLEDAWVLKLNADGGIAWQKSYGGTSWDHAYAIQQTVDGGYVVVGSTQSFGSGLKDAWVFKLDAEGGICEGCPLGENTNALPADSNATVVDSPATAADGNAMSEDSDAIVDDTDAVLNPICTCPLSFCNRLE